MYRLIAVWPYALVFSLVSLWAFFPEWRLARRAQSLVTEQDAGSLPFILWVQRLAIFAAFVLALRGRTGRMAAPTLWFGVGTVTLVAGSLLRRHCFRMLGSSFTGAVVVTPGQAVVERGAYRWIRHPAYTAGALMLSSIGLALGNWLGLLLIVGAVVLTYSYRVWVEERALVARL
jgi:protein-S-isoprenylcysteine O-methyltransferase Ste14